MNHSKLMTGFLALVLAVMANCSSDTPESEADPDISADANPADPAGDDAETAPDGEPQPLHRQAALAAGAAITEAEFEGHLTILADDDMAGRGNLTAGGLLAREYLITQMEALELEPLGTEGYEQAFARGVNLVGRIEGSDPELADQYVLLGAHYDHLGTAGEAGSQCSRQGSDSICNGAADNAAGVSAVLLLAQAFQDASIAPRRSILVAFWDAEEDGLLGSRYFVDEDPIVPLVDIVAVLNLDIVGTELVRGAQFAFALGVDYSTVLRQLVHDANGVLDSPVFPASLTFDGGSGGRSDHKPFLDHDVPVIFYGSGSSPEYHTPADELAVVHSDLALMLIQHVVWAAFELAHVDGRPDLVRPREPHIDDAIALHAFGEKVLEDPAAVGLDDDFLVEMLGDWMTRLEEYIVTPPETEAEWLEYQRFIDEIVTMVYLVIGG